MKSSSSYCAALLGAIAATRFLFRSHYLYDLDSVNFALALRRFDPAVHQPHAPGYFLYVCLGRLVLRLLPDPNTALVAISIVASCGAAWMIYLLTKAWFGQAPAITSLFLFLLSPLAWFHGVVALTYIVEAFFSGLVGYLCWKVYRGGSRWILAASAAYAVAAGFRPSAALFLGPLWLLALWRSRGVHRILAVTVAAGAALAWLIPMFHASGGLSAYLAALTQVWRVVPAQRTTLQSPALAVARIVTIGWVFILCMGSASFLMFVRPPNVDRESSGWMKFFWVWITPGLLFFSFVFFNYVNSGYLLVLCPPAFAWLADRGYRFVTAPDRRAARYAAVCVAAAANVAVFLFAPLYCTYHDISHFERDLARIRNEVALRCDPKKTLIIAFDSHFLGFRHAGYYLPDFTVVQYPEVSYPDGKHVFLMRDRDTEVPRRFSPGQSQFFVFFPLPEGAEYVEYLNKVVRQLPADSLHEVTSAPVRLSGGDVRALNRLFPATLYTPEGSCPPGCIQPLTVK